MSDKIVESILNERDFLIKANDVFNYSFMTVKSYFLPLLFSVFIICLILFTDSLPHQDEGTGSINFVKFLFLLAASFWIVVSISFLFISGNKIILNKNDYIIKSFKKSEIEMFEIIFPSYKVNNINDFNVMIDKKINEINEHFLEKDKLLGLYNLISNDDKEFVKHVRFINYRHQMLTHMEAVLRTNRLGWFPTGCKVFQAHCAP